MAYQAGLNWAWYVKGRVAANKPFEDMYAAWKAAKAKPRTPGKKVTAQESFFQGFYDSRYKNPSIRRTKKALKARGAKLTSGQLKRIIQRPIPKMRISRAAAQVFNVAIGKRKSVTVRLKRTRGGFEIG